jgi:hypothetical protein
MINYEYVVEMYFDSFILTPYVPVGYNRFELFCAPDEFTNDDWACVWALISFVTSAYTYY